MAQDFEPIVPNEGDDNKRIWIIVAVVVLVLCCCCVLISGGAWYLWENGDEIFDLSARIVQQIPLL